MLKEIFDQIPHFLLSKKNTVLDQCLSSEKPRSSVNTAPEPSQELDNPAGGKGGAVSPLRLFLIWWLLKASEINSRQIYEL